MIRVLCASCHTALADTDLNRLDWPMHGEMFTVVHSGWFLRPGLLSLEVFCPVCSQFPFHYDPYTPGGNAVGKKLTIRDDDGKPIVRTIKQLFLSAEVQEEAPPPVVPAALVEPAPVEVLSTEETKEWPCRFCGAKMGFHKKGCPKLPPRPPKEPKPVPLMKDKNYQLSEKLDQMRAINPFIAAVAQKVTGMNLDKGDGPPTAEEIAEVMRDRETRRHEAKERAALRPGEGFESLEEKRW